MTEAYKPDKTHAHLMYVLEARKNSPIDDCMDHISGKVHSKDECEELIKVLKKLGYSLQVARNNTTYVIDEPFPGEGEEE